MGLSGLGDLVLTATGDLSRNRQVGLALGGGQQLPAILSQLGHVAEGVVTAPMVRLTPVDGRRPGRAIGRIAGEERRDGAKVVGVVGGESADPGKTPNIDRNSDRRLT